MYAVSNVGFFHPGLGIVSIAAPSAKLGTRLRDWAERSERELCDCSFGLEHNKLSQKVPIYFTSNLMAQKTKLFWISRATSLDSLIFEDSVYYSKRQIKDYQNRQHNRKQNEKIYSCCLSATGNPIIRLLTICP